MTTTVHVSPASTTAPATAIEFRYLSEPDMVAAGVTDMAACMDTMEDMFVLLAAGDYRMAGATNDSHGAMMTFPDDSPFPTMPRNTADRRFMAMPAYLGGSFGTTGVKWYGSNMDNRAKGLPRSILMFVLNDTDTGAPLAFMSANLLSAYRTGAVPGVGARYLARPDAEVVGIVGPGVMARTALQAFVVACPDIHTVQLKGRSPESIDAFIDWIAAELPQVTTVRIVDDLEDVVRGADIVSYCTSGDAGDPSTYPLVKREWVKPGAFLVMPSLCEIDEGMEAPDVRKVVDATGLYEAWAAEVPGPTHHAIPIIGCKFTDMIEDGRMMPDEMQDIGRIVTGELPPRIDEEEIVLMSVGGMPVEDVAWGTAVYRRALQLGIGTPLPLWDRPVLA